MDIEVNRNIDMDVDKNLNIYLGTTIYIEINKKYTY